MLEFGIASFTQNKNSFPNTHYFLPHKAYFLHKELLQFITAITPSSNEEEEIKSQLPSSSAAASCYNVINAF